MLKQQSSTSRVMCFLRCHSVRTCFHRGPERASKFTKKKKEPNIVHLLSESEVQHFLGVNTLKEQNCDWNDHRPSDIIHSLAGLDPNRAEPRQNPQGQTGICKRAEPASRKLPAVLKCYINSEIQTGAPWHRLPASANLRTKRQAHAHVKRVSFSCSFACVCACRHGSYVISQVFAYTSSTYTGMSRQSYIRIREGGFKMIWDRQKMLVKELELWCWCEVASSE